MVMRLMISTRIFIGGWALALAAFTVHLVAADTNALLGEVAHQPSAPHSGEAVRITAKAVSRVAALVLLYQVVDPGAYIERRDAAYSTKWLAVTMKPNPPGKAATQFTAELPASLQVHRRLVRYRFSAADAAGNRFSIPPANEEVPNFAYFVYDGVPAWSGAINPRSFLPQQRGAVTFDTNVMRRVQPYFLIARDQSVQNVTWREQTGGKEYRYTATLVVDGKVYDHIRMRARGGVWRYAMGKNMWKFDIPKSERLQVLDDYGQPYPVTWNKVNLRACIQQSDYGYRGEQGMFEAVGFRLFRLAGVPAPFTHWIQLRIITGAEENPANQYQGDFWGLYLAIEDMDGRFLRAHDLPDGNLYKMEGGTGALSHHGAGAVTNRSDLNQFLNAYSYNRRPESWWRSQVNLPEYYAYRAIIECIHHYDVGDGKNYYYYQNPSDQRWEVMPWDIDLTWADHMFGSGNEPFKSRVLSFPVFRLEYQNRLREIRDLLFNPEEAGRLIDECAAIIADPGGARSLVDADRAKWDYHPVMAQGFKAGQGLFYKIAPTKDFRGMVQLMKNYVRTRSAWIDAFLLNDPAIPATPTLAYTGPANFPPSQLNFQCAGYRGASAYAATQWRLAEIRPAPELNGRPTAPGIYEVTPVWQSAELTNAASEVSIPAGVAIAGHRYRARVKMKDITGRWSHWSPPVEFIARGKD